MMMVPPAMRNTNSSGYKRNSNDNESNDVGGQVNGDRQGGFEVQYHHPSRDEKAAAGTAAASTRKKDLAHMHPRYTSSDSMGDLHSVSGSDAGGWGVTGVGGGVGAAGDDEGDKLDAPIDELCELYREAKQIEDMTRGDITGLRTWRIIVILILLFTYIGATTGTFLILQSEQKDDTEERYVLFTRTITETSNLHVKRFRHALATLSQSITGAGMAASSLSSTSTTSNVTFPFVPVPLFEALATQTRHNARVEVITWNPLVDAATTSTQQAEWSNFVATNRDSWYRESRAAFEASMEDEGWAHLDFNATATFRNDIWNMDSSNDAFSAGPVWQVSPPQFAPYLMNFDVMTEQYFKDLWPVVQSASDGVLSSINPPNHLQDVMNQFGGDHDSNHAHLDSGRADDDVDLHLVHPHAIYIEPVFAELHNRKSPIVGFVSAIVAFDNWLENLLPKDIHGIDVVLSNTCGQVFTYRLHENQAEYAGKGDLHDRLFDDTKFDIPLVTYLHDETASLPGHCLYNISLYLSKDFNSEESSNLTAICVVALVIVFSIMAVVFGLFDRFVRRRNRAAIDEAARSGAIVSSFFPENIKQRLFAEHDTDARGRRDANAAAATRQNSNDTDNKSVEDSDDDFKALMYKSKPIADLFPETTILCADIVGFTAWASIREPQQVFLLLETLFREFDAIAKKRRIFKVETIGDCYVAVSGLPEPRKDHALAMARFAHDCLMRMMVLTRKLETTLGPDTGDLAIRIGLHSGPVTAGVLRGDRGRFQLFGETMNTAGRMESSGVQNRIQISQETADLLIAAGKSKWVSKRKDMVNTSKKGAPDIQTYWLKLPTRDDVSAVDTASTAPTESAKPIEILEHFPKDMFDDKTVRLIEWNADVLLRLLKQIEAQRRVLKVASFKLTAPNEACFLNEGQSLVNEVREMLTLPKHPAVSLDEDTETIELDTRVVEQMYSYVASIAALYQNNNAFHNFEHASHVVMSMVKLLSRVATPAVKTSDAALGSYKHQGKSPETAFTEAIHVITADPLNQFSFVLSALILDVKHSGMTNEQLAKANPELSMRYAGGSLTKQIAVDSSWRLMMEERFTDLRRAIYQSDEELKRFRQLVVNSVLVTDMSDHETNVRRDQRWDRIFAQAPTATIANRQATAVMERMVQATSVSHTMQHWHIYRKWNKRYFQMAHDAYINGLSDEGNPAEVFYDKELAFFEFVIPLAKKLKECEVFGVSSDEYLQCATRNRNEWLSKGRQAVNEMIEMVKNNDASEMLSL